MENNQSYKTKYPLCLSNNKDLQLGPIYIRYLDTGNIPSLLTIYELEKPSILVFNEINNIIQELENTNSSTYGVKGFFSLAIAYFETMFTDLMTKQLQLFPQKITLLKNKNYDSRKESKQISISQDVINKGKIIENVIDSEVRKIGFENIETLIKSFCEILSIEAKHANKNLDELIEIKESRNLLIHNNLLVNEAYIKKTKSIKRSETIGDVISIDKVYAVKSLKLISVVIEDIILEIRNKFVKYTLLNLLKDLWQFTFENKAIKIEDFCVLNYENDIIDGPFKEPIFISSSEKLFMEFWKAQRTSGALSRPSMVHLDSRNIRKLAFLVEVFGELRLTYW